MGAERPTLAWLLFLRGGTDMDRPLIRVASIAMALGFLFTAFAASGQSSVNQCSTVKPRNLGNGTYQSVRSAQSGATWTLGRKFERVLMVVLENRDYAKAIEHPVMKKLAAQGTSFSNFSGTFHPSYPNYLSMIGGKYFGTAGDHQSEIDPGQRTIADLLAAKGLTWKQYAEGFPGACYLGSRAAAKRYQRKHVPFLSFRSVTDNPAQCAQVVPATQFNQRQLPNYAFYVPDMCNDGHGGVHGCKYPADQMLELSMNWLNASLKPLLNDSVAMSGTLVIVTFDESENYADNHVATIFLGPMVKAGYTDDTCLDHYNVLRTIEDNFGIGNLGAEDANSSPIVSIWK
jgi:hypothetical protein